MSHNKLLPPGKGRWLVNFLTNFFWAIVWLGRSIIRFVQKKCK
jgi:hypothetical protein